MGLELFQVASHTLDRLSPPIFPSHALYSERDRQASVRPKSRDLSPPLCARDGVRHSAVGAPERSAQRAASTGPHGRKHSAKKKKKTVVTRLRCRRRSQLGDPFFKQKCFECFGFAPRRKLLSARPLALPMKGVPLIGKDRAAPRREEDNFFFSTFFHISAHPMRPLRSCRRQNAARRCTPRARHTAFSAERNIGFPRGGLRPNPPAASPRFKMKFLRRWNQALRWNIGEEIRPVRLLSSSQITARRALITSILAGGLSDSRPPCQAFGIGGAARHLPLPPPPPPLH